MSSRPLPSIKFFNRIRNKEYRKLIWRLTLEVLNTPDCAHFTDVLIKNPLHTSHSDSRPHITLRMKSPAQVASQSGQTVHIYYDKTTQEYDAFKLYSERKDNLGKDEPAEIETAEG